MLDLKSKISNSMQTNDLADSVRGKSIYILVLVFFIQSAYPITGDGSLVSLLLYQSLYLLLIGAGLLIVRENPLEFRILVVLGVVWGVVGLFYAFNQTEIWALLAGYVAIGLFQAMVAWVLIRYIFTSRSINSDIIFAASAVYLMLGAVFVPIYGITETLTFAETSIHAFNDATVGDAELFPWQNFIYFSYTTLTTLGYGDITPATWWARMITSTQAIIGVLYITVIMARLVGLYASQLADSEFERLEEKRKEDTSIG